MDFQIQNLFEGATSKKISKGQVMMYEGEPIKRLYYLSSGYVKVYNILASGVERTVLLYGPGDAFPLISYLSGAGAVRYFHETLSDVQVRSIRPEQLEQKVKNNLVAGETLIKYTSTIGDSIELHIDRLSVNDARRKVIALLAFLVSKTGSSGSMSRLGVNLTHQDLADMCGLTRETTSIQLGRLEKEGIITDSKLSIINTGLLNRLKEQLSIVA